MMSDDKRSDLLDGEIEKIVEDFEVAMYEKVLYQNLLTTEYLAGLEKYWWKGFVALEAMYLMVVEFAEECRSLLGSTLKSKEFALLNIHARACQQFSEILCLLKNGFPDGAFARWRSLFELNVYASFISINDEDIAMAYIQQADTETKFPDWAKSAKCFKDHKGRVTFKDIYDNCVLLGDKELWEKQYAFASKVVHPSPQGTFKRLGARGGEEALMAGRSTWGLHIPAEHAAISFYQVSAVFFFFAMGKNDKNETIIKC